MSGVFGAGAGRQFSCLQTGVEVRSQASIYGAIVGEVPVGSMIVAVEVRPDKGSDVFRMATSVPGEITGWVSLDLGRLQEEPFNPQRYKCVAEAKMRSKESPDESGSVNVGSVKRGEVVLGLQTAGRRVRVLKADGQLGWCSSANKKGAVLLEPTNLLSGIALADGEVWGEEERAREWLTMQGYADAEATNIIVSLLFKKQIAQSQWLTALQAATKVTRLCAFACAFSIACVAPCLTREFALSRWLWTRQRSAARR